MKKGTYAYKGALLVNNVGVLYKSDLLYYLKTLVTPRTINKCNATSSRAYKTLLNEGVINEYTVNKTEGSYKGTPVPVVSLTKKGRDILNEYGMLANDFPKEYRTSDYDKISLLLESSTILTYMASVGVPTFPNEKPSLYHLYCSIISNPPFVINDDYFHQTNYLDHLDLLTCKNFCSRGLYYSKKELLSFFSQTGISSSYDQISSSRFKGVFISDHSLIVIYRNKKYRNRLLKISASIERRLLSSLEIFNELCNLNKRLVQIENKITRVPIYNSPRCLVLTNTDTLSFTMSHLNKHKSQTFTLGAYTDLYDRIYAISDDLASYDSLHYLFHATLDKYLDESAQKVNEIGEFHLINKDYNQEPLLLASHFTNDIDYRVVYLPLIECKFLNELSSDKNNYIILTPKHQANNIAKIIGKDTSLFYDSVTLTKLSLDDYLIYDSPGRIAGLYKLSELLAENGKDTSELSLFNSLPKKLNKSFNRFYNVIYKRTPNVEQLQLYMSFFKDEENTGDFKKRIRKSQIAFTIRDDVKKEIELIAKSRNISVSSYIKNIIIPIVKADNKERLEKLVTNKDDWNKWNIYRE